MVPRPKHINLSSESELPQPPRMGYHIDLPSPRTGETPPALSPLDAFAMQSRLLAKQFEREQNGRRISRLPTHTVQKELLNRPEFFRSISGRDGANDGGYGELSRVREEASPTSSQRQGLAVTSGMEEKNRPMSQYPLFGHAKRPRKGEPELTPYCEAEEHQLSSQTQDYFGISVPRASSPEHVDPKPDVEAPSPATLLPSLTNSIDSMRSSQPRTLTNSSTRSQLSLRSERGILPPMSPGYSKPPRSMQSIRSVPRDSGDEDSASYTGAYATSSSRKFSGSSDTSQPQSPYSHQPMHRSPSMMSDYSVNGSQSQVHSPTLPKQRAPFNFSRPRSRGAQSVISVDTRPPADGRKSFDSSTKSSLTPSNVPSRQSSQDDAPTPYVPHHMDSPVDGQNGDYFMGVEPQAPGAPSYTYVKYALPRGRTVQRNSIGLSEAWSRHKFSWEDEKPAPPSQAYKPPPTDQSPMAPKREEPIRQRQRAVSQTCAHALPKAVFLPSASPAGSERGFVKVSGARLSSRGNEVFAVKQRSQSASSDTRSPLHQSSSSIMTQSTDKTIRAMPLHQRSASTELSPEEHLEIGVQAHSAGQLSKSTYHLRLAAMAGLPTAMLFYGLACRHGWGMRASQEDGVMWLRKAIDGSALENFDVERAVATASKGAANPLAEVQERRKRKAQFALAIYELGISYMNGWGCQKDKSLALRCYEIAGSWGDADALAEAGFCYTQGVGCKKDLKKAASLYRKAAEGGISMAGNSWIYKQKYMSDDLEKYDRPKPTRIDTSETIASSKEKSGRPRARSIWGRRKDKS